MHEYSSHNFACRFMSDTLLREMSVADLGEGPGDPLILSKNKNKKGRKAEGRKAGRASKTKQTPPPPPPPPA